jgi:hypothetical protein
MSLFLFCIQGQVWDDQTKGLPRKEHDIIRVKNKRNGVVDADIVGEGAGSFAEAGWYTLTLADLRNQDAAEVGDVLELGLYSAKNKKKKLLDLGEHTITAADIKLGGVVLNFDLLGRL